MLQSLQCAQSCLQLISGSAAAAPALLICTRSGVFSPLNEKDKKNQTKQQHKFNAEKVIAGVGFTFSITNVRGAGGTVCMPSYIPVSLNACGVLGAPGAVSSSATVGKVCSVTLLSYWKGRSRACVPIGYHSHLIHSGLPLRLCPKVKYNVCTVPCSAVSCFLSADHSKWRAELVTLGDSAQSHILFKRDKIS